MGIEIRKILADCDLDGLIAAAVLKTVYPDAEVCFGHPAELRSGLHDDWIDRNTAICDLPFHPNCGLYLDHHATNRPSAEEQALFEGNGGICQWEDKPSAARVAYDLYLGDNDLSHLTPLMPMVDALDSGGITREQLFSDDPVLWLSKTISLTDIEYTHRLLGWLFRGREFSEIMAEPEVVERVAARKLESSEMRASLDDFGKVVDRLAIVRFDDTGKRTNGYLVTAHFGDECDACLIVHGWSDGTVGDHERPPLGASFYSNSFLHSGGKGVMDLSVMAMQFDATGGGHANACGCRVQALDENGILAQRAVSGGDVERNILGWLATWREHTM